MKMDGKIIFFFLFIAIVIVDTTYGLSASIVRRAYVGCHVIAKVNQ